LPKRKQNNYYLSNAAEQDIDEIITYIAEENPKAAHGFLDELYNAMARLSDYPDIGCHAASIAVK